MNPYGEIRLRRQEPTGKNEFLNIWKMWTQNVTDECFVGFLYVLSNFKNHIWLYFLNNNIDSWAHSLQIAAFFFCTIACQSYF